jgi:hypothetical protein
MDRRQLRAAKRADASGSGPTLEEHTPARFPGVKGGFALFGEVLLTGLLVTVAGIAIITLPAALAAGIRHLRRYLNAEASHARLFWQDFVKALPGGLVVGLVAVVLGGLLALDIDLANSGFLPGGPVIAVLGWVGVVAAGVALLASAGAWTPERGWRAALWSVPASVRGDLRGTLFLAATAVFVGVATWTLIPLVVPALGCAALAVVAIPERRRTR